MKQLYVPDRSRWRKWLAKNHDKEEKGIWLVFYKKGANKPTLEYEHAVEEAVCFGWIDSIIKKIDEAKYVRKFTPRKSDSLWSKLNKKRAERMTKQNLMTEAGLAKIKVAKETGVWDKDPRPKISFDIPDEFAAALAKNKKAKENFNNLAFTYRRHYIGWIVTAKRDQTKKRRIAESIALLEQGKKLGLK
jgi:uncharacterized protein YdeI (YjbR/CyaY-like superfamily)